MFSTFRRNLSQLNGMFVFVLQVTTKVSFMDATLVPKLALWSTPSITVPFAFFLCLDSVRWFFECCAYVLCSLKSQPHQNSFTVDHSMTVFLLQFLFIYLFWPHSGKIDHEIISTVPSNAQYGKIQIILCKRRVASGPLFSSLTF